jgi:hypothetical protein
MILLEEPNLLFLKSRKTGGTSFEIALSKFANENSIITPITIEDEKIRQSLGFRKPQNYLLSDWDKAISGRKNSLKNSHLFKNEIFWNHIPAKLAKQQLGANIWFQSYKISIVRNPYDRAVSRYFWNKKSLNWTPDEFENYCFSVKDHFDENLEQFLIDGKEVIDFYIRYESIQQDIFRLEEIFPKLRGIAELFSSLRAKGHYRPKNASTSEIFSKVPNAKRLIAEVCQFEIEKFGYLCP